MSSGSYMTKSLVEMHIPYTRNTRDFTKCKVVSHFSSKHIKHIISAEYIKSSQASKYSKAFLLAERQTAFPITCIIKPLKFKASLVSYASFLL